jgi:hypothetical protein
MHSAYTKDDMSNVQVSSITVLTARSLANTHPSSSIISSAFHNPEKYIHLAYSASFNPNTRTRPANPNNKSIQDLLFLYIYTLDLFMSS